MRREEKGLEGREEGREEKRRWPGSVCMMRTSLRNADRSDICLDTCRRAGTKQSARMQRLRWQASVPCATTSARRGAASVRARPGRHRPSLTQRTASPPPPVRASMYGAALRSPPSKCRWHYGTPSGCARVLPVDRVASASPSRVRWKKPETRVRILCFFSRWCLAHLRRHRARVLARDQSPGLP